MDELDCVWKYQENVDDLKQKLFLTKLELDSVKVQANEEMKKQKIYVDQLMELLKLAYQERDEAKHQLQKLLTNFVPAKPTELQHQLPLQTQPARAHSSITESNSLSETYNHHSHGSSPADSFLDAVSSPEFLGKNMADSNHLGFVNCPASAGLSSPVDANVDPADVLIDNLLKGIHLPPKGELLKTVMGAGPLLQTLLVAGSLPRWRNPPPVQPLKIPPVSIGISKHKPAATNICIDPKLMTSNSFVEMSSGSSILCSASSLDFDRTVHGSGMESLLSINAGFIKQAPAFKRQRFC